MPWQPGTSRSDFRMYSHIGGEETLTIMPETSLPSRQDSVFANQNRVELKGEKESKLAQYADRGTGWYQSERDRHNLPSLLETGRHAGRSRVQIMETNHLKWHTWKKISSPLSYSYLLCACLRVEVGTWSFWAVVWFCFHHFTGRVCMTGFDSETVIRSLVSAFLFSIETQQTIGYGARVPKDCLGSMFILVFQCLTQLLLEAFCVGLVFARLSHPKNRGRSIFMSEAAVICRRDGALKLMFRVGDVRATQVIQPHITAALYMFGPPRTTAEGERITLRVEPLKLSYADQMLLLPVIIEHNIDYTSPLYGQTHDSLLDCHAEVVVTLEGSTETGSTFSVRQSYLPNEIHWGHTFATIIRPAVPPNTHHTVAMSKFHEIEPLPGLEIMNASELSRHVLQHQRGVVPYQVLGECTLCVSDDLVVCPRGSRNFLMVRVGDTYFRDTVQVTVKMYLYQWKQRITPQGEVLPFKIKKLDLKSEENGETAKQLEVLLSMPQLVIHELTSSSPLASWTSEAAMFQADSDSEIVVEVSGIKSVSSLPVLRKRSYTVVREVKWGQHFHVMVSPPSRMGRKPVVDWRLFHTTLPNTTSSEKMSPGPYSRRTSSTTDGGSTSADGRPVSFKEPSSKPPAGQQAPYRSAWAEKDKAEHSAAPGLSLAVGGLQPAAEHCKAGPSTRFDSSLSKRAKAPSSSADSTPEVSREPSSSAMEPQQKMLLELKDPLSGSVEGPIPPSSSPSRTHSHGSHKQQVRGGGGGTSSLSLDRPLKEATEFSKSCNLLSAMANRRDTIHLPHEGSSALQAPLLGEQGASRSQTSASSNDRTLSPGATDHRRRDQDWAAKRSLYSIRFDVDDDDGASGTSSGAVPGGGL
eukprot:CAMPEP_0117690928 /NCGR_PEP_ID=MMETSP0804-20121206/25416_1 /TAXON_ID=1074897 /ORGANISM="Tetraselmis astigmatica, Strain CCMP880" /LENGTH=863 /DNA_ID=CAMNT_0005504063 /DNA_START=77 /DNA_END=2669 /DNA_ORIENTATION=-